MTTFADLPGEQSLAGEELELISLRNRVRQLESGETLRELGAKLDAATALVERLRAALHDAIILSDSSDADMPTNWAEMRRNAGKVLAEGKPPAVAPPGGFVGKCPRCTRVPEVHIAAGEVIGHCAQCWLGEGVRVPFVELKEKPA